MDRALTPRQKFAIAIRAYQQSRFGADPAALLVDYETFEEYRNNDPKLSQEIDLGDPFGLRCFGIPLRPQRERGIAAVEDGG
jgi:hypothetical protein